jgi:hypothetical protein
MLENSWNGFHGFPFRVPADVSAKHCTTEEVTPMTTWRSRLILAATVVTGCTGKIQSPDPGAVANPPTGSGSTGAGASTGTGATGTGAAAGAGATMGAGAATGAGATGGTGAGGTGATGGASACVPGVPGTSQLPRLTRVQFDNTIRDLVGLNNNPSAALAPDSTGSVDQRAWDGYQAAAEALAAQIMADPAAKAKAIPCTPTGDGVACASQFIASFGKRAFRRPLTLDETTKLNALYADRANITATGSFDEAAQVLLHAFLVSPSFLTRAEIAEVPEGPTFVLNGHEVASRLSYMLWGSMPDDALFVAAENGALSTSAGILTEAQRMLNDPKARSMVAAFHEHYAHMGAGTRWADISRDPQIYPAFNAALVPALAEETTKLFDHVTFDLQGTFQDLLLTPVAFVNQGLATIYGIPGTFGSTLTEAAVDPALRPGIFTRAGFLTAYSLYNRPSAILRGAFIQKDLLCTAMGSPPPGAEGTPQPTAGLATNRERTDAQTAGADCAGCHHGIINPTGYAMEAFDAIGAYQTMEKDTLAAIDTTATVPVGTIDVDVLGPADLMKAIAASPEAQRCYAKKWVEHAFERTLNANDACTVEMMANKLTAGGYTIKALIADLTQSQTFRFRAVEVTP